MEISSKEVKQAIFNLVTFTDDVDESGKPAPRKTFPKSHLRGIKEVKDKVIKHLELAFGPADKEPKDWIDGDVEWVKYEPNIKKEGKRICSERHTDEAFELSDAAIKAIKFCYGERNELPDMSVEALDELEKIVK